MAQKVIGLDLGSSAVKAIVVRLGMRGSEVLQAAAEPVELDEQGRSTETAVFEAAQRLVSRLGASGDIFHCAVPGEAASLSTVTLPASASRRLDQVLKFELDEVLAFDIEDAVYDYVETRRTSEEIELLAAVVRTSRVERLLRGLEEVAVDPREIGVAPLAYRKETFDEEEVGAVRAVVDIGHTHTDVAILDDAAHTNRTILRGGRDLTQALAQAANVPFAQAEANKKLEGLNGGRVSEVLRGALRPLTREIKQTLKGHLASGGKRVERIILLGGGALLPGLDRYLQDELGLPVELRGVDLFEAGVGSVDQQIIPEAMMMAFCLARREEIAKPRRVNMRRGPFAFKGDYEFLRRRILWAVACVVAIVAAWGFSAFAQLSVLEDQAQEQKDQLIEETTKLFGKPILVKEEIEKRLSVQTQSKAPMPETDAFDIVVELSKRIPFSVVHDIELLDIKPKRITIKAIVDADLKTKQELAAGEGASDEDTPRTEVAPVEVPEGDEQSSPGAANEEQLSPTDLIQKKLSEFEKCFTAIRIGKVQTVKERRKYQMDIESKCP